MINNGLKTYQDLVSNLDLPEEIYPILNITEGLVLFSGSENTGKSTMLQLLTKEFDKKYTREDNHPEILLRDESPRNKIIGQNLNNFGYFPNANMTANIQRLHNKMIGYVPNLIIDDELRNGEQAYDSFESSLNGHLVYSTIHAHSAQHANVMYERLLRGHETKGQYLTEKDLEESLEAVIHMKRDEATGLPVVGEVKIF